MASINYGAREINVKIVYYGPGLSGKTTNLQVIHRKVPPEHKSDMVSLATETDRTLFFDFLPLDLGTIKGFSTKFQLYTVPGQVYYNATRKLVLRGVDGVVFVADSGADKIPENGESFQNLEDNLAEYRYKREDIPIIIQYNKRDLPNAMSIEELQQQVNRYNLPYTEAVANKGIGVFDSLKLIGKIVIDNLNRKYSRLSRGAGAASSMASAPPPRPVPAASDPVPSSTGYDPRYYSQTQPSAPPPPPPPHQQQYPGYSTRGYGTAPADPYQQQVNTPPIRPARQPAQYPGKQNRIPPPPMPQPQEQQQYMPPPQQAAAPSYPMQYHPQPAQKEELFPPAPMKTGETPQQQNYGYVNFEPLPIDATQPYPPPQPGRTQGHSMPAAPPPQRAAFGPHAAGDQAQGAPEAAQGNEHAVVFPPKQQQQQQQQQQRPARSKIDERDYNVYHVDAAQHSFPKSAPTEGGVSGGEEIFDIGKKDEDFPNKPQKRFLSKLFNRDARDIE